MPLSSMLSKQQGVPAISSRVSREIKASLSLWISLHLVYSRKSVTVFDYIRFHCVEIQT